jgi:hypothetical protein
MCSEIKVIFIDVPDRVSVPGRRRNYFSSVPRADQEPG